MCVYIYIYIHVHLIETDKPNIAMSSVSFRTLTLVAVIPGVSCPDPFASVQSYVGVFAMCPWLCPGFIWGQWVRAAQEVELYRLDTFLCNRCLDRWLYP